MKPHLFPLLGLLLAALLTLAAGCGAPAADSAQSAPASGAASAQASSSRDDGAPDQSIPAEAPADGSQAAPEDTSPQAGDWRGAYLAQLNDLCDRYGRFVQDRDMLGAVTGVKYANLLDFDGDGVRELLVLAEDQVYLYTCRAGRAELLYQGTVGGRFGQTDVSYTFGLNVAADTPCLIVYHTEQEWTQEAITLVTVSGGAAVTTELSAQADGRGDLPTRDALTDFQIDGQTVDRAEYEARLDGALEGALELDRDWAVDPVTAPHLEAVFAALEAEDGDYLLPEADAVCLTGQDLAGLSADQLRLARNEIFARQGRTFQDQALQDYFDQQDWYVAIYTPEQFDALEGRTLNRYEAANLALIQSLEADRQG